MKLWFIRASLSKHHIDCDNGPRNQNLYHLPRVCYTLVHEICVCHKMFRVFWYIHRCVHVHDLLEFNEDR